MTFDRLIEPFNNRLTSTGGAVLVTTSTTALVKNLTDATWLEHLWFALHGSAAVAADQGPVFQLVAIGFGYVLGSLALYIGAPWFVKPTQ
jgi:hypothetical protein